MKKLLLNIFCAIIVAALVTPTWALARERQERDTTRDTNTEETNEATASVQNSIVVSTKSSSNSSEGDIATGDQETHVSVETIINGEVVQSVEENGDEEDRDSQRNNRRHIVEDRGRGIIVDTEIIVDEEGDSNETGNQNKDGADGQDGQDGQDGDPTGGHDNNNDGDGDDGDDGNNDRNDRRDRGDRGDRTVAFMWSRISNFFTDVLFFWV